MHVLGPKLRSSNGSTRGVSILGSTGSVGTQALEVIRRFKEEIKVYALSAHRNVDLLVQQALEFRPECVVIGEVKYQTRLREMLSGTGIRVLSGHEGLVEAATLPRVDTVLAALVGYAGLESVLAAIKSGKKIALANKETLVVAGALVNDMLHEYQATIIPVDSEHSAIFQCLVGESNRSVESLLLTASGGPFRTRAIETFEFITLAEALQHPNWSMGSKITIDSATMMNKGLEVIEAHWLFNIEARNIQVLIHPQSIIHSMVIFSDGSTKAQLGVPDMKIPIQYALSYPDRWYSENERIDWRSLRQLDFEEPDFKKFPCLQLAYDALKMGGTAPAILNAANEEAVALFLREVIKFTEIPLLIEAALEKIVSARSISLGDLTEADIRARHLVKELSRTAAN